MSAAGNSTFACTQCGACCRVPGYVRLLDRDVARIAAYLGMREDAFVETHTRLTADRQALSLHETQAGACAYLTDDNHCRIQAVKPAQCVGFPFVWHYQDMHQICEGWQYEKE